MNTIENWQWGWSDSGTVWIACEQKGSAVQASLLSTANMGAACQIMVSANFSLNGQSISKPRTNMWKRRHLEQCLIRKEKHSGRGLYFNNQMKGSTAEFLITMPIISCKYSLSIPDRNPIARVTAKSAYSCVWFLWESKPVCFGSFFCPQCGTAAIPPLTFNQKSTASLSGILRGCYADLSSSQSLLQEAWAGKPPREYVCN